jgi:hypothetical protein
MPGWLLPGRRVPGLLLGALCCTLPTALPAQAPELRLTGEVRTRGEAERPAVTESTDALTLLRSRLGVEARLSPRALVFVQLQDSRTFGEETSTADGSADRLDMHQAWLQYGGTAAGLQWAARAGRQEIALGTERLIGAVGWSNTGRAFDALRLTVGQAARPLELTAFAATVQERGRRFGGAGADAETADDHLLVGTQLVVHMVELFTFHDVAAAYRSATGADRTTAGARIAPTFGRVSAAVEGAYQFGNQLWNAGALPVAQDLRAHMYGGRLALAVPERILTRVGIGADVVSGDADPADDTYRAFNTLYATNHKYYGYIDYFTDPAARTRDRGLVDGMVSATVALPRALSLDVDAHGFWLHRSLPALDDRLIGWELDLTLPVRLGAGQSLQLGYSTFRNAAAAPLIGLGRDGATGHWAYVQATFSFGGSTAPVF